MNSRSIRSLNRNNNITDKKSGMRNEWNLDFISLFYFNICRIASQKRSHKW